MQSMTYGTMPTIDAFREAFERECPNGRYHIRLSSSGARATENLRARRRELRPLGPSSIMDTLGFEWI